jgi:hypothetical protein
VVLIDSQLAGSIPKGELAGSQIIEIDGKRDAVGQITAALEGLRGIGVLRVVSHGAAGSLRFGNHTIDAAALHARKMEVAAWSPRSQYLWGSAAERTRTFNLLIRSLKSASL